MNIYRNIKRINNIYNNKSYKLLLLKSSLSSTNVDTSSSTLISKKDKYNVLMYGSGAIGLYYGGRLLEKEITNTNSNTNVKFIARSYYEICKENGYTIKSIDGDINFSSNQVKDKFYNDSISLINSNKDNLIDYLIITIKSYAINENIKSMIDPLIKCNPNLKIILIINGYGVDKSFVQWYGSKRVFVTLAFTCINRIFSNNSLIIDHSAVGHLLIGHCDNDIHELQKMKEIFSNSKIRVETTDSLLKSIWSKLVWNITFNGLSLSLGGVTTDIIANDKYLRHLATNLMREIIELANKDIHDFYSNRNIDEKKYLIDESTYIETMWKYTDNMGKYKTSSAIDLVNGSELEIEYLFSNVWNRAKYFSKNNNSYPYLDQLLSVIHGISNIANKKRKLCIKWNPIDFN